MAVPKQKISKSKRGMRRGGNTKIIVQNPIENKTTGELTLRHHVDPTGHHNGRKVTDIKISY